MHSHFLNAIKLLSNTEELKHKQQAYAMLVLRFLAAKTKILCTLVFDINILKPPDYMVHTCMYINIHEHTVRIYDNIRRFAPSVSSVVSYYAHISSH